VRYGYARSSGILVPCNPDQRAEPDWIFVIGLEGPPLLSDILGAFIFPAPAAPSVDHFEPFFAAACFVENHHQGQGPIGVTYVRVELVEVRGKFRNIVLLYVFHSFVLS
jgi:hypothetical protein